MWYENDILKLCLMLIIHVTNVPAPAISFSLRQFTLTHRRRDQMDAGVIFNCIFFNEKVYISITKVCS